MKKLILSIAFIIATAFAFAQNYTYVNGYYRSNGTYVQGHYRTAPNNTRNDNWSTIGNVNPFTGVAGTQRGDTYGNYSAPGNYNSYGGSYSTPSYNNRTYGSSYSAPSSNYNNYGSTYSSPSYNYSRFYNYSRRY